MRLSELKAIQHTLGGIFSFYVFLIFLATAVFLGWIGDSLFELINLAFNNDFLANIVRLVISFSFLLILFLYIKKSFSKLRSYELDVVSSEDIKPKKVLILFLSELNGKNISNEDALKYVKHIKSLDDFEEIKINWEMPILAIRPHLPKLERLIVITSKKSGTQFNDFKNLVNTIFEDKEIEVIKYEKEINFERVEEVYDAIKNVYEKLKNDKIIKREDDFIVDVTGGQKVTSIAGAIFTTEKEGRKFQYVSTLTKKIVEFDVLLDLNEK